MATQIALRVPDELITRLDTLVTDGRFPNRTAAVREGVELLLRTERNRQIAEEYRRAYEKHPQEEWFAEASAHAMGEILARERREQSS